MKIHLSIATASGGQTTRECTGSVVRIGREAECELAFPEATNVVSRNHARIELTAGGATLTDTGSSNGTLLNDRKIKGSVPLSKGDCIRLGHTGPTLTVLELDLSEPPAREPVFVAPRNASVGQGEPAMDTDLDLAPFSTGPWAVEKQPVRGNSRSAAWSLPFAPTGRRTWLLLVVAIAVVGIAGISAHFLFRPRVYGRYGGIERA